jgi:uncharacterized protein (DUF302 family)
MRRFLFAAMMAAGFTIGAQAGDDVTTMTSAQPFDDVAQAVNDAIVNRGYTIDYHGFIGDMLKRTAGDVGADEKLYNDAEFFTFCSAVLSRDVMEANPADIAYCPYVVFVYQLAEPGSEVTLGYRRLPEGDGRDQVNSLLDDIIAQAADGF